MSDPDDLDRVPDFPPFRIVIDWIVGDGLDIDIGDLETWEAQAALQKALELLREAEDEDAEADTE